MLYRKHFELAAVAFARANLHRVPQPLRFQHHCVGGAYVALASMRTDRVETAVGHGAKAAVCGAIGAEAARTNLLYVSSGVEIDS
jgi:hypothetical protein